jgi:hypothetical protein
VRYFLIAALVVAGFSAAGFAQQSGTLSYSLSNPPTALGDTSFGASIGGVKGTITTTGWGSWTMTVDGRTFATGTYSCGGGSCSFAGTTLAGRNLSFSMTGTGGTVPGVFTTHGAWVSTVAGWANSRLSGRNIGEVVSQAAGGKGHDPSHDPSHGSAQSAASSDHGAGPGNSDNHGGSGDHGGGGHGGGTGHDK